MKDNIKRGKLALTLSSYSLSFHCYGDVEFKALACGDLEIYAPLDSRLGLVKGGCGYLHGDVVHLLKSAVVYPHADVGQLVLIKPQGHRLAHRGDKISNLAFAQLIEIKEFIGVGAFAVISREKGRFRNGKNIVAPAVIKCAAHIQRKSSLPVLVIS